MENRLREGGRQINCITLKTNFLLYTSSEHTVVRSLKSVCVCVCTCACVCAITFPEITAATAVTE